MGSMPMHDRSAMVGMNCMGATPKQVVFNEMPRMTGDYFGVIKNHSCLTLGTG
jgi:hypothetical protein